VNSSTPAQPVTIIMIEDDEGHARLIEKNIRRAGVNNPVLPFANGSDAVKFLFGADGTGAHNQGKALLILLDLNLPDMSGIDYPQAAERERAPQTLPSSGPHYHGRRRGDPSLLRPRVQCLHHQACELRELR
jgi:CheY-like chemotaxis protein